MGQARHEVRVDPAEVEQRPVDLRDPVHPPDVQRDEQRREREQPAERPARIVAEHPIANPPSIAIADTAITVWATVRRCRWAAHRNTWAEPYFRVTADAIRYGTSPTRARK
jgi:hypothetical protein